MEQNPETNCAKEGLEFGLKESYFADVEERRDVGPCPNLEGSFWSLGIIHHRCGQDMIIHRWHRWQEF